MNNTTTFTNKLGTFTLKRPTIGDFKKIEVIEAREKEGEELDIFGENLAHVIATLDVVVTGFSPDKDYKEFSGDLEKVEENNYRFDARKYYDFEPVMEVFTHWLNWVNSFRSQNL